MPYENHRFLDGSRVLAGEIEPDTRVLRLTLLAPEMVEAILDGRQDPEVTLAQVLEPFPVEWRVQAVHLRRIG